MNLGYLAYKNMVSKPLNLLLSLLLLSLSVSLVTFVLQLNKQLSGQLNKNIAPFDMVVGAKGSPLQLVLSSVLHIDAPTGNIKLKDVAMLQNHPFVEKTIPVSYGDNYKGYRLLGTELEYLEKYNAKLQEGRLFQKSFEVVVGNGAATRLNLALGDTFTSSHGLVDGGEGHDHHPYEVVGILQPTGSVVDQLLISNLESVWEAHSHDDSEHNESSNEHHDHDSHENEEEHGNHNEHDHEHENHEHSHEGHEAHEHHEHEEHDHNHEEHDHKEHEGHDHDHEEDENLEITSLLVKFKSPLGMVQLPRFINENTSVQAALPGFEIQRLMGLLGSGATTINGIALAILLVSGLSIFISLLKTIRERRQELALLRTYGFQTKQLLGLALLEGLFLALIGFVSGWVLGRLGIWILSGYMSATYGYTFQVNGPEMIELSLMVVILILAIFAALMASISIFKLNVAKTLSNE
ncbi:ABC transporter permease [Flagellimonas meridianipacifica]|uniref:Putative ABC transport system permease protein n=1 Tax=Flagellimonas meridianipacifica TaxID=1080225 RepID=A0A2T0MIT4_9FLAO|nr:ABC transporter permease [Allomuricauda pacifica]PRX57469.1 putative ABC transport system permease protein [Allomuricauda pacifica]